MSSSPPMTLSSDSPTIMPSKSQPATPSDEPANISPMQSLDSIGDRVKKRKRNRKDGFTEDPQSTKKPRATSKNSTPELGATNVGRQKRVRTEESAETPQTAKRSRLAKKSLEPQSLTEKSDKRKRSQEDDFADTLQPAKKARPTIEELERELEATKDELESTKRKLGTAESSLEMVEYELEHADIKYEVEEGGLICKFTQVGHYIFNFIVDCLVKRLEVETIPEEVEKALDEVSDIPIRKYLAADSQTDLYFIALIWRFLCVAYLDKPFKLWGETDEFGQLVASIQLGELGGDEDLLNRWRQFTGQIFYNCPIDDAKLRRHKKRLLQLVEPFIVVEKKDKIEAEVEPKLNKFFDIAVSLARNLNRYIDRYEIRRRGPLDAPNGPLVYDDTWMQIRFLGLDDNDTVDFLVAPALIIRGKSPSSDVEKTGVLRKAEICYKNGPRFVNSDEHQRMKASASKDIPKNAEGVAKEGGEKKVLDSE
ncbi:hypothetical protein F5Y13DRAFT_187241 [Hypoxylon sp. FL1857]|nr:hypothetical protein F5Y13DRAFT_187241 [Hypoxylon sp. FL1857]